MNTWTFKAAFSIAAAVVVGLALRVITFAAINYFLPSNGVMDRPLASVTIHDILRELAGLIIGFGIVYLIWRKVSIRIRCALAEHKEKEAAYWPQEYERLIAKQQQYERQIAEQQREAQHRPPIKMPAKMWNRS